VSAWPRRENLGEGLSGIRVWAWQGLLLSSTKFNDFAYFFIQFFLFFSSIVLESSSLSGNDFQLAAKQRTQSQHIYFSRDLAKYLQHKTRNQQKSDNNNNESKCLKAFALLINLTRVFVQVLNLARLKPGAVLMGLYVFTFKQDKSWINFATTVFPRRRSCHNNASIS